MKSHSHTNARHKESGNAFMLILLGVILFASLGFYMSRSMRSDTVTKMSAREADLIASEIIEYGNLVARAYDRLRARGISENEIDFSSNVFAQDGASAPGGTWPANPNCSSDECRIFKSVGGFIDEKTFTNYTGETSATASTRPNPGHPAFYKTNIAGTKSDDDDVMMYISNIPDSVCTAINDKEGIVSPSSGNVGPKLGVNMSLSDGYWNLGTNTAATGLFATGLTVYQGHDQGCLRAQSGWSLVYFKIINNR